ncbi:hypothetical protein TWF281_001419 [Arthrobotrys megalospora]
MSTAQCRPQWSTVSVTASLPSDALYTATEETSVGMKTETEYGFVTETSSRNAIATVTGIAAAPPVEEEKRALRGRHCSDMTSSTTTTSSPNTGTSPVPSYASTCTSGARYASACSCFGVPASIATVGASTTTSTITVSVTETVYTTNSVAVDTVYITVPAGTETTTIASTTTVVSDFATNTVFALFEIEGPHSDGRLWLAQVLPYLQFYFDDTADPLIRDHDGRVYHGQLGDRRYGYCEYGMSSGWFDPGEGNDAATIRFYQRNLQSSAGTTLLGNELYCDFVPGDRISCRCTTPEGVWTKFFYGPAGIIQLSKEDYVYRAGEGPLTFKTVKPRESDYCGPNTEGNAVCVQYWDAESPYRYKKRDSKIKKRRLSG